MGFNNSTEVNTENLTINIPETIASDVVISRIATNGTSPVILLAANSSRLGIVIENDHNAILYVLFGDGIVSTTNFSYRLPATSGRIELLNNVYVGIITGINASGNGNAQVTEIS